MDLGHRVQVTFDTEIESVIFISAAQIAIFIGGENVVIEPILFEDRPILVVLNAIVKITGIDFGFFAQFVIPVQAACKGGGDSGIATEYIQGDI